MLERDERKRRRKRRAGGQHKRIAGKKAVSGRVNGLLFKLRVAGQCLFLCTSCRV